MSITFVTTTSHGTWLPGDLRGYVRKGVISPGDVKLLELSRQHLKTSPVYFSLRERGLLFDALLAGCAEFRYRLSDVAIESWHLHWILFHGEDPVEKAIGRLKPVCGKHSLAAKFGPQDIALSRCSIMPQSSRRKNTLRGIKAA